MSRLPHQATFALILMLAWLVAPATEPAPGELKVNIDQGLPSVTVMHGGQEVLIKRKQDTEHTIEFPYNRTSRPCPPYCIQPIQLHAGVETIGELELLEYLKKASEGDDVLVIDSRTQEWREQGTIPGSISIPWKRLDPKHTSEEAIAELLQFRFGAAYTDPLWDFSEVKTLVLFCNGAWCGQSPTNIRNLISMGYPANKLKWYRGGMQSWTQLGLTVVGDEDE